MNKLCEKDEESLYFFPSQRIQDLTVCAAVEISQVRFPSAAGQSPFVFITCRGAPQQLNLECNISRTRGMQWIVVLWKLASTLQDLSSETETTRVILNDKHFQWEKLITVIQM